jgi:hypothetical protein
VLTKGGLFMVCNEAQRPEGNETWIKMLKMAIYTGVQIKELMERAGFRISRLRSTKTENDCVSLEEDNVPC